MIVALTMCISCAQVPNESTDWLSYQRKIEAGNHWNDLAKDFVKVVEQKLPQTAYGHSSPGANQPKGYVSINESDLSPFGETFRSLITTHLTNKNIAIDNSSEMAMHIDWDINKIIHESERVNQPSVLKVLAVDIPQFIILGETDWPLDKKPHTEILLTFKLSQNELPIYQKPYLFYVNDADGNHYWQTVDNKKKDRLDKLVNFQVVNY
jgi:hypothetical protein